VRLDEERLQGDAVLPVTCVAQKSAIAANQPTGPNPHATTLAFAALAVGDLLMVLPPPTPS